MASKKPFPPMKGGKPYKDNPKDSPAKERGERKKGIKT